MMIALISDNFSSLNMIYVMMKIMMIDMLPKIRVATAGPSKDKLKALK